MLSMLTYDVDKAILLFERILLMSAARLHG